MTSVRPNPNRASATAWNGFFGPSTHDLAPGRLAGAKVIARSARKSAFRSHHHLPQDR